MKRNGEDTYLVRCGATPHKNNTAVCLLTEDGTVRIWYSGIGDEEIERAVEEAKDFVRVHSVMTG